MRIRLQKYSRAFLLAAIVVTLGIGCFFVVVLRGIAKDRIVEDLRERGHVVYYDYSFDNPNREYDPNAKLQKPEWLVDLLGTGFFAAPEFVGLRTFPNILSDEDLAALNELHELKTIVLHLTQLPQSGPEEVRKHEITRHGCSYISQLRKLDEISLFHTMIDDSGLRYLGDLHDLSHLTLTNSKINGEGLVHLRGLMKLQQLDLSNN